MSSSEKVGAVMPTLNQHEWIRTAIASVLPQVDFLVIVDDGSDPAHDFAWLEGMDKVEIVHHGENRGAATAINTGIQLLEALGDEVDWYTWVSSDNVYTYNWIAALLAETDARTGAVYSGFYYETTGRPPRTLYEEHSRHKLISQEHCYYGPSFLIRRQVWQDAGGHRGKISHDYDHWLRVEEACYEKNLEIVGVPTPLCHYNFHDQCATVTRRDEYDAPKWKTEARKRRKLLHVEDARTA